MLLLMLLTFLVLVIGLFAFMSAYDSRNEQARLLRDRLAAIDRAAQRNPSEELALLRDELLSGIPALNRVLSRTPRIQRLQTMLSQADMKIRPGKFVLISACSAAVGALAVDLALRMSLVTMLAFVGFALLPLAYVAVQRKRRFSKFETLFPEAIDLLARAVRAGHAFNTSMELIATELAEPVSGEFRKVFEELKFGLPVRDAMLNLTERMPITDVKIFVTAVLLQRETGGNLAEILDKLSYIVRERFKILREVRTYTAQGRMTLLILMMLPPGCAAALTIVAPDFISRLFTDPLGHMLIAAAIVSQTIGFFLIRKIIHIQV